VCLDCAVTTVLLVRQKQQCRLVLSHSPMQRESVGDREIRETYLNSAPKNTSETFSLIGQNLC